MNCLKTQLNRNKWFFCWRFANDNWIDIVIEKFCCDWVSNFVFRIKKKLKIRKWFVDRLFDIEVLFSWRKRFVKRKATKFIDNCLFDVIEIDVECESKLFFVDKNWQNTDRKFLYICVFRYWFVRWMNCLTIRRKKNLSMTHFVE